MMEQKNILISISNLPGIQSNSCHCTAIPQWRGRLLAVGLHSGRGDAHQLLHQAVDRCSGWPGSLQGTRDREVAKPGRTSRSVLLYLFGSFLSKIFSDVHGVDPALFSLNWFLCLFVDTLPVGTYLHIWDAFLFEGSKVSLAIIILLLIWSGE